MRNEKINVLVVDDSAVARALLVHILDSDPEIEVTGVASTGEKALSLLKHKKPDVITMDVNMPGMDGFETTKRILEVWPVPIVIISTAWDSGDKTATFRSLEAGAVAFLSKPRGVADPNYEREAQEVVQTVKLMSEIKVIRRIPSFTPSSMHARVLPAVQPRQGARAIQIVAVGVSTGGPPVLQSILSKLPPRFPFPVVIVQHIATGFADALVKWLNETSALPVHVGIHGTDISSGHIYIAPGDKSMAVTQSGRLSVTPRSPNDATLSSVAHLLKSVRDVYGAHAVGVLLTGMGRDGAHELKLMRQTGALTIAQDKASSIVFGMPGEAVKIGAAMHVLPPDEIARLLTKLAARG